MKICMVGSGRMAGCHSRALVSQPDVELHTVVNPNTEYAERLRREMGYQRVMANLDEALADESLDVVVVCTPNPLHFAQASAALRAGKHVLCELPVAMTLSECEELARLAAENGLRLMACHTQRFRAGRIELRRRIAQGELHPIRVQARLRGFRRGELKTEQARSGWVDNMLWHHGAHLIDAVMDIIGPHEARGLHVQWSPAWPSLGLPLDVDLHWKAISPITGGVVLVSVSLSHNSRWGVG